MGLKTGLVKILGVAAASVFLHAAQARDGSSQLPLLLIGASYANGSTPYNNGAAPLGGIAVGFGSYLSLGQALTRTLLLPGYVINEGQAGAGTFAHPACAPGASTCGPVGWDSYLTMLNKALSRVAQPPTFTTFNAKYVVILSSNDCLHSDASGIPQALAMPCTPAQMNQTADRMVAVGNAAIAAGLTPIYDVAPKYEKLDLPSFQAQFGLNWVIGQADYTTLRNLVRSRVQAEVHGAIVLDIWKDFEHLGDGIHPTPETSRRAAAIIAAEIWKRDLLAH
jgi:hypothetical protein